MAQVSYGQMTIADLTDNYQVQLSPESASFAGGTSSAKDGNITVIVSTLQGNKRIAHTIGTPTGLPSGMTVTNKVNGTATADGSFKVNVTTTLTSTNGYFTIPITVGGVVYSRRFSYSVGREGTSVTITNKSVTYQVGSSGTTAPTGTWQNTVQSPAENQYLWTKTEVTYSDGNKTVAYSVSRNAKNGVSPTATKTQTEYQQSTNGTTPPTGTWFTSAPDAIAGQYMWTRTTVTYSDGATSISYSVSRNGADGTSPTAYSLVVSHAAIEKNKAGTYNPTSITVTAKSQTGTAAPVNWANGYIKIESTTNNTSWTNVYSAKATTRTQTIPTTTGLVALRCSLYYDSGYSNLLDQQTIPIVSDGTDGAPAYTVVLSNESHTFSAGTSAVTASQTTRCDVIAYKGTTRIATDIGTITSTDTKLTSSIKNDNTTNTYIEFTANKDLASGGTVTIPVTVDGKSFTKVFTFSLAFTGVSISNVTSEKSGDKTIITIKYSDGRPDATFEVKDGAQGAPGDTGATAQWYYGTDLTHTSGKKSISADLTPNAVVGSMYLNPDTSLVYRCTAVGTSNEWTYAGDLTTGVINNIEIGGRNLILCGNLNYSSTLPLWKSWATVSAREIVTINNEKWMHVTANGTNYGGYSQDSYGDAYPERVIYPNTNYIVSFDAYASAENTPLVTWFHWRSSEGGANIGQQNKITAIGTTRKRYSVQFVSGTSSTYNIDRFCLMIGVTTNASNGAQLYITNIKMEQGNIATEYTPAPEDIESEVSALRTDLQSQIDEKIQTYYQSNDPNTWSAADRQAHDGDLWYYTGTTTATYTKDNVYRYNASSNSWVIYSASGDLFDKVDGKSTIFYGTTNGTYTGVQKDDYLVDSTTGNTYKYDPTVTTNNHWVEVTNYKTGIDEAKQDVVDLDTSLNQQEVFNRLTDNKQNQGLYIQDGNVYLNADMINTGYFTVTDKGKELFRAGTGKDGPKVSIKALDDLGVYFDFTGDGLIIGKNNYDIKLYITNDKLSFKNKKGQEVAYISSDKLYINSAEIEAKDNGNLQLGDFAFIPQSNGNLSFRKVK